MSQDKASALWQYRLLKHELKVTGGMVITGKDQKWHKPAVSNTEHWTTTQTTFCARQCTIYTTQSRHTEVPHS